MAEAIERQRPRIEQAIRHALDRVVLREVDMAYGFSQDVMKQGRAAAVALAQAVGGAAFYNRTGSRVAVVTRTGDADPAAKWKVTLTSTSGRRMSTRFKYRATKREAIELAKQHAGLL